MSRNEVFTSLLYFKSCINLANLSRILAVVDSQSIRSSLLVFAGQEETLKKHHT